MKPHLLSILPLFLTAHAGLAQDREPFGSRPRGEPPQAIVDRLERRIQHDMLYGLISREDWQRLRADAARLRQVQREYGRDGYSSWESSDIARQLTLLRDSLVDAEDRGRLASGSTVPRYSGRDDAGLFADSSGTAADVSSDADRNEDKDEDGARPGEPLIEPGGAYPEKLSVGDEAPVNLGLPPDELRSRYRDGNGVYYRYWGGTIYEVDEATDRIRRIGKAVRD